MLKYASILLLCLFLPCLLPASAQQDLSPWQAWVYLPQTGHVWLINERGETVNEARLPAGEGAAFSPHAAVSPGGTLIAYSTHSANGHRSPAIFNTLTGQAVRLLPDIPPILADSFDFANLASGFPALASPDVDTFPYGYRTDSGWALVIMTAAGEVINALTAEDLPADSTGALSGSEIPVPYFYDQNKVIFALTGENTLDGRVFVWFPENQSVRPLPPFEPTLVDYFPPTGEAVYLDPSANILYAFLPQTEQTIPFYQDAALVQSPLLPRFAGEGNYILAANAGDQVMVIARDGIELGRMPTVRASEVGDFHGIDDGFIYTALSSLVFVDISDGVDDGTPLVFLDVPPEIVLENPLRIIWAQDGIIGSPGPFLLWNNLAGSDVLTVSAQIVMTVEPGTLAYSAVDAGLTGSIINAIGGPAVGGQTRMLEMGGQGIVTQQGAPMGLYYQPSTNAILLRELPEGTLLNVLEGPVFLENDQWWRVSTLSGQDGWVIAVRGVEVWVAPY